MSVKKQHLTAELINSIADQQQVQKVYKINATSLNIAKVQSSIKKYNKLRCIILDFNYIDKMENFGSLFDLRELHLQGNMITKIAGLQTCKNITVLNLAANQIQVVQGISHLGRLQNLDLSKNMLQKINNLQSLKQLKYLNLSYNKITSLNSLPSFSKLQTLLLNNNNIQSIPAAAFSTSSKLVRLDLSFNKLLQCPFISKLTNLQSINLANNRLRVFTIQSQLKYLEQLNLQNNQLQSLPPLGECFPQLVILNLNNNMFCSQHEFITMISQSNMLAEVQFAGNPIHNQSFENTLLQVFKFDRINKKNYNQPGSKYLDQTNTIQRQVMLSFADIEDDQQDRKIRISGFYNDQLQAKMTGIKPHRAVSPATKKARGIIANQDLNDIARNYTQFIQNDKRIKHLRQFYENICLQNNIQRPKVQFIEQNHTQTFFTQQQAQNSTREQQKLAELRLRNDNNEKLMIAAKRDKSQKWQQLKARTKQKSFNIRKSRTKQVNSSLSKISSQISQSRDLMKTQMVPHKFMTSKLLQSQRKTANMFYRPSSQK